MSREVHPLRRLRKQRGLTQKRLADMAGVQQSYVSTFENGLRPRYFSDAAARIANTLDVPVEQVVGHRPAHQDRACAGS